MCRLKVSAAPLRTDNWVALCGRVREESCHQAATAEFNVQIKRPLHGTSRAQRLSPCPHAGGHAQQPTSATTQPDSTQPTNIDDTITAGEAENEAAARKLVNWNEYQGPLGSIRFGFGFLWDRAHFSQDENSKSQVDLPAADKLRDFRLLFSGRLGFKRPTTWTAGVMDDANKEQWVMRQTGIMVAVPEIWGHIFVGRTKEGVSLNKVMIGYGGWTMERSQMNDATLPILADGIKWLGYVVANLLHIREPGLGPRRLAADAVAGWGESSPPGNERALRHDE